jgi:hypothetical protein
MKHLNSTQAKNLIFLKRFVLTIVTLSVLKYIDSSIAAEELISKVKAVVQINLV